MRNTVKPLVPKSGAASGPDPEQGEGASGTTDFVYRRPKATRRGVLLADRLAGRVITVGGTFVIVAVMGILVFLVHEVIPLFRGGTVEGETAYTLAAPVPDGAVMTMDEYRSVAVAVGPDGSVAAFHPGTGTPLEAAPFPVGKVAPTAFSCTTDGRNIAYGYPDGTVRFGTVAFHSEILPAKGAPAGLVPLEDGALTDGTRLYTPLPGGRLRRSWVEASLDGPVTGTAGGRPVTGLVYRTAGTAERPTRAFVTVDPDGALALHLATFKRNLMTGKMRSRLRTSSLPPLPKETPILRVLMTERADAVYVATPTGRLFRYDVGNFDEPRLAETARLTPPGTPLTAVSFLAGENALMAGTADGAVTIHFPVQRSDPGTADGVRMVKARTLAPHPTAVVSIVPSRRGKIVATLAADGTLWLRHATSEKTLMRFVLPGIRAVALSPRDDGLLATDNDGSTRFWTFSVPHPETSWRTLFGRVWYEGYPAPSFTWQSTGGTDAFESKLSLVPLVFGTLKGTFYSMLFAVPIALLAAIYTSEFVPPRVRGAVKPVMEMMASLPSVVLGFVAALVLAPVVETWVTAVLSGFLVLPVTLVACGYLWQFLPARLANRLEGAPRLTLALGALAIGLLIARWMGPWLESLLFGGNFRLWLDGGEGTGTPLWFLLLLPPSYLAAGLAGDRVGGARLRGAMRHLGGARAAGLDAVRWILTAVAGTTLACLLARAAGAFGLDPRGGLVGTYVQRNTLIIAFAMGFAVIPIIYTLAEDALAAVPQHLRSASLGCGATPWQTARWVVLPTAMSGVFSAVMIGMGRAVGETMIVVMAAGNTPILDANLFNGLRALSANIAVELPEAVVGGTLYRTLFLSALVLFAMTFVINTLAEVVRIRFRRRSVQL